MIGRKKEIEKIEKNEDFEKIKKLIKKLKNLIFEVPVQNRAEAEADISDQDSVDAGTSLIMQLHQRSPRIFAAVSPLT